MTLSGAMLNNPGQQNIPEGAIPGDSTLAMEVEGAQIVTPTPKPVIAAATAAAATTTTAPKAAATATAATAATATATAATTKAATTATAVRRRPARRSLLGGIGEGLERLGGGRRRRLTDFNVNGNPPISTVQWSWLENTLEESKANWRVFYRATLRAVVTSSRRRKGASPRISHVPPAPPPRPGAAPPQDHRGGQRPDLVGRGAWPHLGPRGPDAADPELERRRLLCAPCLGRLQRAPMAGLVHERAINLQTPTTCGADISGRDPVAQHIAPSITYPNVDFIGTGALALLRPSAGGLGWLR